MREILNRTVSSDRLWWVRKSWGGFSCGQRQDNGGSRHSTPEVEVSARRQLINCLMRSAEKLSPEANPNHPSAADIWATTGAFGISYKR